MNFLKLFSKGSLISLYHQFHKPPYGGGNQFLLALRNEFKRIGYSVDVNWVGKNTKACLFNSFNFDFEKIRIIKQKYPNIRLLHRVDGPVGTYRGYDDGTDNKIWEINNAIANATIFQSEYSFNKHIELGMYFKHPVVIPNSVDPKIFNRFNKINLPDGNRKIRLIATSWSDNSRKGGEIYKWIEECLDWNKYEFTFVGRTQQKFRRIKHILPCSSINLSNILRQHDIYLTASIADPCSNSLLEALACGLPAIYLKSGGHLELVKDAGVGFLLKEEVLDAIDKVAYEYKHFQQRISIVSISTVANKYLTALLGHNNVTLKCEK